MKKSPILQFKDVSCDFFVRQSRLKLRTVHALKNINFELYPGQTLGVVGHNGSGKSTLLQIIAGILNHTSGDVYIAPDISVALLSLQLGFSNELTGIENAILGSMYLGSSKKKAMQLLDKILDFAEIGEWANDPLYTYSTGMRARLGFAVAMTMKPEIMLIDEVMGVGDRYFQIKSQNALMSKMNSGQTTVLVSHMEDTLRTLCDNILWLNESEVHRFGPTETVLDEYVEWIESLNSNVAGIHE